MGLDPRRQGVSWEESESNKKQKSGNKRAADRYFSAVSRQLLRSEPPVPTLPTIPECSDAIRPTSFVPLGDEEENKEKVLGRSFSLRAVKGQTLQGHKYAAKPQQMLYVSVTPVAT